MLKQSLNAAPFARKLMAFFVANTLLCFLLMVIVSEYVISSARNSKGDESYANYGILIEALIRQPDGLATLNRVLPMASEGNLVVCLYDESDLLTSSNSNVQCASHFASEGADYTNVIEWRSANGQTHHWNLLIKPQQQIASRYALVFAWCLILAASCVLAWWLSARASRRMLAPVHRLLDIIKMVTESRDYSMRADVVATDTLGILSENFNSMIADIESRNHDIVQARRELEVRVREVDISNRELSTALQRLKSTQQQLINNEKMASLGGLVAGVAHEINTPVGVGVTAASTLLESTRSVSEKYNRGELTNSALLQYIQHATSAADIILGNLERAANLIQSFKLVAVDQSNSDVRYLVLKEYLGQVLVSLHPQLRKTALTCEFDCPADIGIRSYPGALSQILANFVMNAIVHAYEQDDSGKLLLRVYESDIDTVCICFSDDGKGIPPENIGRVWDPFFTTNRSGGGSGLGLHIVYNLVTQQLCGSIEIESQEGQGTMIRLFLPKDVGGVALYE